MPSVDRPPMPGTGLTVHPTSRFSLAVLLLLAAAPVAGEAPVSAAKSPAAKNLLLVTIDTLRADSLGVNGAADGATPNLDRLARNGINFSRARAATPLTLPSHASILTGLYPPAHGVRDNGSFRLASEHQTLAETLEAKGYDTAAFVASFVLDRRFGLAQGFAHYDDRITRDPALLERLEAERNGGVVLEAFSDWLRAAPERGPFFAWVHLYDPHAPYQAPEPYGSRHGSDPYAAEVAFVDAIVGRLVSQLEAKGLSERTLVAVVGDHGEGLGEHGETTHALFIYNSTLHVPMLLSAPALLPRGLEVDRLVRLIDLAPTLLDYLGIATQLGEGVSLKGLIDEMRAGVQPTGRPLTAYSESLYGRLNLGWSPLYGLESEDLRLIMAPRPELYDLASDPRETTNLMDRGTELGVPLRRELRRKIAADRTARPTGEPHHTDPETAARLRSLGYLSGSAPAATTASLADPKSKTEVWSRIQLAMAQYGRGDYRKTVETLESLLLKEQDLFLLYDYLGATYQRLDLPDRAERIYRQAAGRGLATSAMHAELGLLLHNRGRPDLAGSELATALALDPANVLAHHRLGDVHRRAGRHREAAESYHRALEVNPAYIYSWNGLGMALATAGADDQAFEAFRRAVELAPDQPAGLFNLAVQLEHMGRLEQARRTYLEVIALTRENPAMKTELERATAALERLD